MRAALLALALLAARPAAAAVKCTHLSQDRCSLAGATITLDGALHFVCGCMQLRASEIIRRGSATRVFTSPLGMSTLDGRMNGILSSLLRSGKAEWDKAASADRRRVMNRWRDQGVAALETQMGLDLGRLSKLDDLSLSRRLGPDDDTPSTPPSTPRARPETAPAGPPPAPLEAPAGGDAGTPPATSDPPAGGLSTQAGLFNDAPKKNPLQVSFSPDATPPAEGGPLSKNLKPLFDAGPAFPKTTQRQPQADTPPQTQTSASLRGIAALKPGEVFDQPAGEGRLDAKGSRVFQTPRGELIVAKDGLRTLKLKPEPDGSAITLTETRDSKGRTGLIASQTGKDDVDRRLTRTYRADFGPDGGRSAKITRAGVVDGTRYREQTDVDAQERIVRRSVATSARQADGTTLETSTVEAPGRPKKAETTVKKGDQVVFQRFQTGERPASDVYYDEKGQVARVQPGVVRSGGERTLDFSELSSRRILTGQQIEEIKGQVEGGQSMMRNARVSPVVDFNGQRAQVKFEVAGNRGEAPSVLYLREDRRLVIQPGVDSKTGKLSDMKGLVEVGALSAGELKQALPLAASPQNRPVAIVQKGDARQTLYEVREPGTSGTYRLVYNNGKAAEAILPVENGRVSLNVEPLVSRGFSPSVRALLQDVPAEMRDARGATARLDLTGALGPRLTLNGLDARDRAVSYGAMLTGGALNVQKQYVDADGRVSQFGTTYNGRVDAATGQASWDLRRLTESQHAVGPDGQVSILRSANRWETAQAGAWKAQDSMPHYSYDAGGLAERAGEKLAANPASRYLGKLTEPFTQAFYGFEEAALKTVGRVPVWVGATDKVDWEVTTAATEIQRRCAGGPSCGRAAQDVMRGYSPEAQRAFLAIGQEKARSDAQRSPTLAFDAQGLYTGTLAVDANAAARAVTSRFSMQNATSGLMEAATDSGAGGVRRVASAAMAGAQEYGTFLAASLPFAAGGAVAQGASKLAGGMTGGARSATLAGRAFQTAMTVNQGLDATGAGFAAYQAYESGNSAELATQLTRAAVNFGAPQPHVTSLAKGTGRFDGFLPKSAGEAYHSSALGQTVDAVQSGVGLAAGRARGLFGGPDPAARAFTPPVEASVGPGVLGRGALDAAPPSRPLEAPRPPPARGLERPIAVQEAVAAAGSAVEASVGAGLFNPAKAVARRVGEALGSPAPDAPAPADGRTAIYVPKTEGMTRDGRVQDLAELHPLYQVPEFRSEAKADGRLFGREHVARMAEAGPDGRFNYIIVEGPDGIGMKLARRTAENPRELGIKHAVLAKGEKVLYAGEARYDARAGRVELDLNSGTYSEDGGNPGYDVSNPKNAQGLARHAQKILGPEVEVRAVDRLWDSDGNFRAERRELAARPAAPEAPAPLQAQLEPAPGEQPGLIGRALDRVLGREAKPSEAALMDKLELTRMMLAGGEEAGGILRDPAYRRVLGRYLEVEARPEIWKKVDPKARAAAVPEMRDITLERLRKSVADIELTLDDLPPGAAAEYRPGEPGRKPLIAFDRKEFARMPQAQRVALLAHEGVHSGLGRGEIPAHRAQLEVSRALTKDLEAAGFNPDLTEGPYKPTSADAWVGRIGSAVKGGRLPGYIDRVYGDRVPAMDQPHMEKAKLRADARLRATIDKVMGKRYGAPDGAAPQAALIDGKGSVLDLFRKTSGELRQPGYAERVAGSPRVFAELVADATDPGRRGPALAPGAAETARTQAQLASVAEAVARRHGRDPGSVTATVTDHVGGLGIIEKGRVLATNPQGDSPAVWGGRIRNVTPYATGHLQDGRPAVMVLFDDGPSTRLSGDRLSGEPAIRDILAMVVTDGRKTTVLDRKALEALNSSARELERAATLNPRLLEVRARLTEALAVKSREAVHELSFDADGTGP